MFAEGEVVANVLVEADMSAEGEVVGACAGQLDVLRLGHAPGSFQCTLLFDGLDPRCPS